MVVTATNKELQFDWIMHSPNVRHSSRSFYIASLMVYIKKYKYWSLAKLYGKYILPDERTTLSSTFKLLFIENILLFKN